MHRGRGGFVRLPGMAIDRQTIEKRDFPIGRRGYEPEAVDAHLARIADEVDALRRQPARRSPESIASVASHQVASIVQAAETTAAELEREAQDEADRIRREADAEARAVREEAADASEAHVGRVSESVGHMLQRVDAMESELGALLESLRTGANRLQADLTLLQGSMSELASTPPVGSGRRAEAPRPEAPADVPEPPRAEAAEPVDAEVVEETVVSEAPAPAEPVRGGDAEEDVEGARLIALNMALNGTGRDETDRYLADNFDLSDRQGLLDEVYASVEG